MIFLKPTDKAFPETFNIYDGGWVGTGGQYCPELILDAYSKGLFPLVESDEHEIEWFCPSPRLLLYPEKVKIHKSLKSSLNKFTFGVNTKFEEVVDGCATAKRSAGEGTWITPNMRALCTQLHQSKVAYSFETFYDRQLVGGLYGFVLGGCFFGESMFAQQSNASKSALVILSQILKFSGFAFIDCQQETGHLTFMGGIAEPLPTFFTLLEKNKQRTDCTQRLEKFSNQRFSWAQLLNATAFSGN